MRLWPKPRHRSAPAAAADRRARERVRTRLRPGKLLDAELSFLADCAIVDRSDAGLRVRCFGEVDGHRRVTVFVVNDGSLQNGRLAWSRLPDVGICLEGEPVAADADALRRIAGPYYAVGE
jgi:hypothetical protein